MRLVKLSPEFKLPMGADYDDIIAGMADDIDNEEGSARRFLRTIRDGRRNDEYYNNGALAFFARHGLQQEQLDGDGKLVDPLHKRANAITAGMIFGNVANEGIYPLLHIVKPYAGRMGIIPNLMTDEGLEDYENKGGAATIEGVRSATKQMAAFCLANFSQQSDATLREWGTEVTMGQEYVRDFVRGFGAAAFMAWDVYGDILIRDGRSAEITRFVEAETTE